MAREPHVLTLGSLFSDHLVLLQTCRVIHDEMAHIFYSRNTFIFNPDSGWLGFWVFSHRLLNKHHLRHLQFHLGHLLDGPNKQNDALSLVVHAGLETLNALPKLGVVTFVIDTDLTYNSLNLVSQFCQVLQYVQCSLVFNKRKCEQRS